MTPFIGPKPAMVFFSELIKDNVYSIFFKEQYKDWRNVKD